MLRAPRPRYEKRRKPLPLIAFLHGFLADKTEYLSETKNGTGPDRGANGYKTVHWNNVWFASRGYAVLNYSHRGHGNSGGYYGNGYQNPQAYRSGFLRGYDEGFRRNGGYNRRNNGNYGRRSPFPW